MADRVRSHLSPRIPGPSDASLARAVDDGGTGRRRAPQAVVTLLGLVAWQFASLGWAQQNGNGGVRPAEGAEVAPFRITGIEGFVRGRYWQNGNDNVSSPSSGGLGTSSSQTLTSLRGDVFVLAHSYVFHPNLLLLDVGAGPVGFRQGYSTDGLSTTGTDYTYNLTAKATILRDKPYRGSVFFERLNDSYPVGPAQSLLTENTRYGFDAALLAPVSPVPVRVDASHLQSRGTGTTQVIDEQVDQANVYAERQWNGAGETRFHYQWSQDDSMSGSLGLPIQLTRNLTNRADLDTRLSFGEGKQYDLFNTVMAYQQRFTSAASTIADTNALRFDLNLQARNSPTLQTRARYQFDYIDQSGSSGDNTARLNGVDAGLTYQPAANASGTLDVTATDNRSTPLNATQAGIRGTAQYTYAMPVGELAANYAFAWFKRDQTATEQFVPVVGERHLLPGTAWITLRHQNVVPGSVLVSNAQRTQTFIEGRDYELQVIGLDTQIRRLIGGDIVDGQEVLVDYTYDTGGTYGLTEFDNSFELAWRYNSLFSAYVRYVDTAPNLTSGLPTVPLNPMSTATVGARADVPFDLLSQQMMAGGFVQWEDHREDVSPYRRTTFDGYLESSVPLLPRGGLRVGALRQNVEYEYTPEQDSDTQTYTLRLWSRFTSGITLSAQGTRTSVSGSPQVAREYRLATLRALWRVRKVVMTLDLSRTRESQGIAQTRQTLGQFEIRRDF